MPASLKKTVTLDKAALLPVADEESQAMLAETPRKEGAAREACGAQEGLQGHPPGPPACRGGCKQPWHACPAAGPPLHPPVAAWKPQLGLTATQVAFVVGSVYLKGRIQSVDTEAGEEFHPIVYAFLREVVAGPLLMLVAWASVGEREWSRPLQRHAGCRPGLTGERVQALGWAGKFSGQPAIGGAITFAASQRQKRRKGRGKAGRKREGRSWTARPPACHMQA